MPERYSANKRGREFVKDAYESVSFEGLDVGRRNLVAIALDARDALPQKLVPLSPSTTFDANLEIAQGIAYAWKNLPFGLRMKHPQEYIPAIMPIPAKHSRKLLKEDEILVAA